MKVLIVSDVHGSYEKFKKIMDFMKTEEIDQMIILGDLFNNYYELNTASKEISNMLWSIADTFNGLMAIPNLIALFLLSGTVVKLLKEKFQ